ncbi:MAG: ABC transporter ATP-binding protein [Bacteroidales bacterium]|nr:MAG: ABC transporter ATP-binding protein [Bacteroidales bacterium]
METILNVNSISKVFGSITAVDRLSFSVHRGDVVGVLGPNGSGKTTTLSIILSVINASSGDFSWFNGLKGEVANRRIGSLLEVPYFYPYLNLERNLMITALARGAGENDIPRVLDEVGLLKRSKSAFYTLSLGMKQRLAIASTLIGDPEVLVLDEPTNGLDPEGIAEVRDIIKNQALKGKTIIMASHILDEVEKVCPNVIILKKGKCIASGKVAELLSEKQVVLIESDDIEILTIQLGQNSNCKLLGRENGKLLVELKDNYSPSALNNWLFSCGISVNRLEPRHRTLESQFLELVGKPENI